MPRKPEVRDVHPQTMVKGQVVWVPSLQREEVVRSVSVVLHLASGQDVVYDEGDRVEVLAVQPQPLPEPQEPVTPTE